MSDSSFATDTFEPYVSPEVAALEVPGHQPARTAAPTPGAVASLVMPSTQTLGGRTGRFKIQRSSTPL